MRVIGKIPVELPRFNQKYHMKSYRYNYGVGFLDKDALFFDGIIKTDVHTGEQITWSNAGFAVGEPIFIANPESEEEDGGALLVVALDIEAKHSKLVILDAKTMKEIAYANVTKVVPFGFHGNFFGDTRTDQ